MFQCHTLTPKSVSAPPGHTNNKLNPTSEQGTVAWELFHMASPHIRKEARRRKVPAAAGARQLSACKAQLSKASECDGN